MSRVMESDFACNADRWSAVSPTASRQGVANAETFGRSDARRLAACDTADQRSALRHEKGDRHPAAPVSSGQTLFFNTVRIQLSDGGKTGLGPVANRPASGWQVRNRH